MPGRAEERAQAAVVEDLDAVEVDGHEATGVITDQPQQRVAQHGHRRQVDRAAEREDRHRPHHALATFQLHRREGIAASYGGSTAIVTDARMATSPTSRPIIATSVTDV